MTNQQELTFDQICAWKYDYVTILRWVNIQTWNVEKSP